MDMFNVQADQTPGEWSAILQRVESGETVQVLRGERVVAVLHSPDDLNGWVALSASALAKATEGEDFSDWKPPHAAR